MNVTIDVKMLIFAIVGIALIVLIIYLIQLARKLMVTLEHTNKILEDTQTVTELAAKRSKDVDEIISEITESLSTVSKTVRGDQNVFAATAAVIKAAAAVVNAAKDKKDN